MKGKALNKALSDAKRNKKDEFYTQLSDIENELKHYREHFRDKTVFCKIVNRQQFTVYRRMGQSKESSTSESKA